MIIVICWGIVLVGGFLIIGGWIIWGFFFLILIKLRVAGKFVWGWLIIGWVVCNVVCCCCWVYFCMMFFWIFISFFCFCICLLVSCFKFWRVFSFVWINCNFFWVFGVIWMVWSFGVLFFVCSVVCCINEGGLVSVEGWGVIIEGTIWGIWVVVLNIGWDRVVWDWDVADGVIEFVIEYCGMIDIWDVNIFWILDCELVVLFCNFIEFCCEIILVINDRVLGLDFVLSIICWVGEDVFGSFFIFIVVRCICCWRSCIVCIWGFWKLIFWGRLIDNIFVGFWLMIFIVWFCWFVMIWWFVGVIIFWSCILGWEDISKGCCIICDVWEVW